MGISIPIKHQYSNTFYLILLLYWAVCAAAAADGLDLLPYHRTNELLMFWFPSSKSINMI